MGCYRVSLLLSEYHCRGRDLPEGLLAQLLRVHLERARFLKRGEEVLGVGLEAGTVLRGHLCLMDFAGVVVDLDIVTWWLFPGLWRVVRSPMRLALMLRVWNSGLSSQKKLESPLK